MSREGILRMKKSWFMFCCLFSTLYLEANPFKGLKYDDLSSERKMAIKLFDLKVNTLAWAGGNMQDCEKAYKELISGFDVGKDFNIDANGQIVCKQYFAEFEYLKATNTGHFNVDVLKILSNEGKK